MDLPHRVNGHELFGHGQNGLLGLCLNLFPRASAKTIHGRWSPVATDIFLDEVNPMYGQIETISSVILQVEKLSFDPCYLEKFEPTIDPHPVIKMDHGIILLEFAQAGNEMTRMRLFLDSLRSSFGTEDFIHGDQDQPVLGQTKSPR